MRPGVGEELVDRVPELRGLHVVGVATEGGNAERAVGRIGPRAPTSPEAGLPPVRDIGVGQPPFHRFAAELRMAAAGGEGAHVDDDPDARAGYQRREVVRRQRSVPDRAEAHHRSSMRRPRA